MSKVRESANLKPKLEISMRNHKLHRMPTRIAELTVHMSTSHLSTVTVPVKLSALTEERVLRVYTLM